MGAGFSSFSAVEGESQRRGFGDIPEGCVASVLMHLRPTDICRLARLSQSFRGAEPADFSKKDIHARLCRLIPFDGSTKVVWMEKSSDGIRMSISAKALSITGIDDRSPEILEVHSNRGV